MKIFNLIGLNQPGLTCKMCKHFNNDPSLVEEVYPGLTAFSSGFASVRDQDGFCNYNQLYLSARDSCPSFAPLVSGFGQEENIKAIAAQ